MEVLMVGLPKRSPWLTIEAVALIVLGILAIIFPLLAGIAAAIFFGWLLIIVGVLGLISAIAGRAHAHLGWSVASAVIAILVGLLLLTHPLGTATLFTIRLAAYFLFDGVTQIGYGLDQKKRGALRWRWPLGAGVVDIFLAVLLLVLSGVGSAALIGIIVGIDLIIAGVGLFALHRSPFGGTISADPLV
jgi:uncharacterized membrane protein HdeD (DUF308 family)